MRPTIVLLALVAGCGTPAATEESSEGALFNYCFDYKHCSSDAQCPSGQFCYSGDCRIYPLNSRCEWYGDDYVARNAAGDRETCFPHICVGGVCPKHCYLTSECAIGFVCDHDTQKCINNGGPSRWDPPNVAPDRESANLCANGCYDRPGKPYERCVNGSWLPLSLRCSADRTSQVWDGIPTSCGSYLCDRVTGHCLYECTTTGDCAVGYVCNDGRRCIWGGG